MQSDSIRRTIGKITARIRGDKTPAQTVARLYERMTLERNFLTETLPKLVASEWRQGRCIFVLSTGRAGSMQLAALLGQSRDVISVHEPSPMLLDIGAQAYAEDCQGDHWRYLLHGARDDFLAFATHNQKIYVETNNRLTFLAPAVLDVYPECRFIHLHRHPYDVIRSGLNRGWYNGSAVDFSLIQPRPQDAYADRWESMSPTEKIAWFWLRVNEGIMAFTEKLPPTRSFVLPSRELFSADAGKIGRLFEFVGVETPSIARIRRSLARQLNARKHAAPAGSDDWGEAGKSLSKPIVGNLANRLGYEI